MEKNRIAGKLLSALVLVATTVMAANADHPVQFDINNDGRDDILFGQGWYEGPEGDPLAQPWNYHPDWDKKHAACPMLVVDVDGDGTNDVINSTAHGFGLHLWRGLGPNADGKLQFDEQLIDDSFSQPHCLCLADLDDDGDTDIVVAGKEGTQILFNKRN